MMKKKCLICGAEFESAYSSAQYCSDGCRRVRIAEVKAQIQLRSVEREKERKRRRAEKKKKEREQWYEEDALKPSKEVHYEWQSLCWTCKCASSIKCSWMKDCTPVEGWTANFHILGQEKSETYNVRACPLYVHD